MAHERKDHTPGERFGLVVFVRFAPSIRVARCLVRCDCGAERVVNCCDLRRKPPKTHRLCRQAGSES